MIAWGGGEPSEEKARDLALAEDEEPDVPDVDPTRLMPRGKGEGRLHNEPGGSEWAGSAE